MMAVSTIPAPGRGNQPKHLLYLKEKCTGHIYCESKCCIEPHENGLRLKKFLFKRNQRKKDRLDREIRIEEVEEGVEEETYMPSFIEDDYNVD